MVNVIIRHHHFDTKVSACEANYSSSLIHFDYTILFARRYLLPHTAISDMTTLEYVAMAAVCPLPTITNKVRADITDNITDGTSDNCTNYPSQDKFSDDVNFWTVETFQTSKRPRTIDFLMKWPLVHQVH